MESTNFSILRYGRFYRDDSSKRKLVDPTDEIGTQAACYELEFYYADCPGGLTIDGVHFPAKRGFFTCCKPGQHRKMVLPYKCLFFNITTQDPQLREALDKLPGYAPMGDTEKLLSVCTAMVTESRRNTLHGKLLAEGCVCTVLSMLFRNQYTITDVSDHNVYRHQQALLAANDYLREHLLENVDLNKLAHDSGLHPTYFHKLFTAAFRKTPAQQLMLYRVRAAIRLLMEDELSISEISDRCGFSTPNYFCYKFRELTGRSPSQYRKNIRERAKKANEKHRAAK